MRKSGFIMLLTVALLLSIQFAAVGLELTKDAPMFGSVILENKISVQEEVRGIDASRYISESVAAIAVSPIQAEAIQYLNTVSVDYLCFVDYSYCVIPYNFSGSAINKITAMPGGGLLYAGFL